MYRETIRQALTLHWTGRPRHKLVIGIIAIDRPKYRHKEPSTGMNDRPGSQSRVSMHVS
jgi:hypothetical protein